MQTVDGPVTPCELQELATHLYARHNDGVVVAFVQKSMGEWHPVDGQCHYNVDWWVLNNPDCKAVRGWLVFDHHATSYGLFPFASFNPHSVVEEADGTLIDITPSPASRRYPFIRHEGTDDDFAQLVTEHNLTQLQHRVR